MDAQLILALLRIVRFIHVKVVFVPSDLTLLIVEFYLALLPTCKLGVV